MFGNDKRKQMADTIREATESLGSAGKAVAAIVILSTVALALAVVAVYIAVKGRTS